MPPVPLHRVNEVPEPTSVPEENISVAPDLKTREPFCKTAEVPEEMRGVEGPVKSMMKCCVEFVHREIASHMVEFNQRLPSLRFV